ncbi:MAG: dipeptidase [Mangrovibacterium sp.]
MKQKLNLIILALFLLLHQEASACTNFLVTKGASKDGSTLITYAADSHGLYGELYFQPAANHSPGTMRKVYEWDTGKYLGEIPEVAHTYSVIGNMNEHQLAIAETTFGGRKELSTQEGAILDYGSLIYITLQRAKTARQAIEIMTQLVSNYGYYSSGESFSLSDKNEVWIMEMIGKGEGEKGAVWVARRVPEGYVSGHANQARITTISWNDSENCLYSDDVMSFAQTKGWYEGNKKEFSFSDTYAPVDFGAARFCDARIYAGFNKIKSGMKTYEAYAEGKVTYGKHNYATNRLPLWVKPDEKLSLKDVMELMRDHYEGTSLDMTKDIGAGPYQLPYRWRNMTWEVDSVAYCHERATSTQQTAFSFVSQSRDWLPDAIGGILWFGVDDTYSTCYAPMYSSITQTPECFRVGNGDMLTYSPTAAFWTFTKVSNFAYLRYAPMIKDVQAKQAEIEGKFIDFTPAIDLAAQKLYNEKGEQKAREFLTTYSVNEANNMTAQWEQLFQYLLIKYMDGNVKKEENGQFLRTETGYAAYPDFPGYPQWWLKTIAESTGDKLKVIGE